MVILDTDIILAAASKTDKHHNEATYIIRNVKLLTISPYVFIELDWLIRLNKLKVILPDFYKALDQIIQFYSISIAPIKPVHMSIAQKIREIYGLTYFDSLHAAVAITENDVLLSYNQVYSRVTELKYIHPSKMLKSDSYH